MPKRRSKICLSRPWSLAIVVPLVCGWANPLLAAATAPAAGAPAEAPSMMGELLGILLPLALIILALFAVLHFARRRFGLTGQNATPLTILQILPVGPRERIVLVKARSGRVFAVGVAGQSVTFLTNFDPDDLTAPESAAPAAPSAEGSGIPLSR
ncbi:flagellar biosynthetic protein FliO [Luteimonas aquatica]|uniref:flagellar biosynthetic protein FliO n=1 Tax=Luteimonas aquatica TaxID=450364 RepID=UPI001F57E4E2|nr:flagellar biosynthetic protein FliO [Luteimonas aquatica]